MEGVDGVGGWKGLGGTMKPCRYRQGQGRGGQDSRWIHHRAYARTQLDNLQHIHLLRQFHLHVGLRQLVGRGVLGRLVYRHSHGIAQAEPG